jgi:hypothetical protein
MTMNEPMLVPEVEAVSDVRNVQTVRFIDRSLVRVVLSFQRVIDVTGVIDEMYVVIGHLAT